MTKEQAIEWLKSLNYCDGEETQEVAQAIDMAIKVLEQQSEDCVSRKYIKQIVSNITAEYDTETIHIDRLMDEIDDLPPVTPTRKVGKWIFHEKSISTAFKELRECSCCHCYFRWEMPRNSYCPNCGAEMRGTDNE